jgi:hypothetical protein
MKETELNVYYNFTVKLGKMCHNLHPKKGYLEPQVKDRCFVSVSLLLTTNLLCFALQHLYSCTNHKLTCPLNLNHIIGMACTKCLSKNNFRVVYMHVMLATNGIAK